MQILTEQILFGLLVFRSFAERNIVLAAKQLKIFLELEDAVQKHH